MEKQQRLAEAKAVRHRSVASTRFAHARSRKSEHKGDDNTPAVMRLVSRFLKTGKPDAKVVLLSRTNFVTWTRCLQPHASS